MNVPLASAAGLLVVAAGCSEPRREDAGRIVHGALATEPDGAFALTVGREVARVRTTSMDRAGTSVRGAAMEAFTPRGEGVEQTWRFERAPGGDGDLIVRVAFDDLTFVGTAACGARFRRESSGAGICYGRATWVDAAGVRTAVPWSIDARGVAMRVRTDVLEGSAYPAVLDPIITPEVDVGDFAWGPTIGEEYQFTVASGNSVSLAVYASEPSFWQWTAGEATLVARLLGATGTPFGAPIELAPSRGAFAVGFDGELFRIFATNGPNGAWMFRVTTEGEVLDPAGVTIQVPGVRAAACAPGGSCALVGNADITRVGASGAVLDVVPLGDGGAAFRDIVRVDGGYLITGSSTTGTTVGRLADTASQATPDAWLDSPAASIWTTRTEEGTVLIAGVAVDGTSSWWHELEPGLDHARPRGEIPGALGLPPVPTPAGFVTRLDDALVELSLEGTIVREAAAALPHSHGLVVPLPRADGVLGWVLGSDWAVDLPGSVLVDVLAVTADEASLLQRPTFVVSQGPAVQVEPRIATSSDRRAILFVDHRRFGAPAARLRLFDGGGAPLGDSVEVSGAPASREALALDMAMDHVAVAWSEGFPPRTLLRRYAFDGSPVDPAPVLVREGYAVNAVLTVTDDAVVVGLDHFDGTSTIRAFASGDVLVGGAPIVVPGWVTAASQRGDELWMIHGPFLSRFALDGWPIALAVPREVPGDLMACGDGRCMTTELSLVGDVAMHELHADGSAGVPLAECSEAIALGWDGTSFVSIRRGALDEDGIEHVGAWHTPAGLLVDEAAWVANPANYEERLEIAGLGGGSSWVVYENAADLRLRARELTSSQNVPTTTSGAGAGGAPDGTGGDGGDGGGGGGGGAAVSVASAGSGSTGGTGGEGGNGAGGTGGDATGGSGGSGGEAAMGAGGLGGGASESASSSGGTSEPTSSSSGSVTSAAGPASAASAGTGPAGAGDGGGGAHAGGNAHDGAADDGGCACGVPAGDRGSPLVATAGLALLALRRRRRTTA